MGRTVGCHGRTAGPGSVGAGRRRCSEEPSGGRPACADGQKFDEQGQRQSGAVREPATASAQAGGGHGARGSLGEARGEGVVTP